MHNQLRGVPTLENWAQPCPTNSYPLKSCEQGVRLPPIKMPFVALRAQFGHTDSSEQNIQNSIEVEVDSAARCVRVLATQSEAGSQRSDDAAAGSFPEIFNLVGATVSFSQTSQGMALILWHMRLLLLLLAMHYRRKHRSRRCRLREGVHSADWQQRIPSLPRNATFSCSHICA